MRGPLFWTIGTVWITTAALAQVPPPRVGGEAPQPPAADQSAAIPPPPPVSGPGAGAPAFAPPPSRTTPAGRRALRPQESPPPPAAKPKSKTQFEPLAQTEDGLVNLDFTNVEIADIAKSISELTKRNIILDEKVRGKVTIISPKPVTVEEAFQAFISALEVKNFTIVTSGKLIKIIESRESKSEAIPTNVTRPIGGDDAFVTRLIPIRFIKSSEIVKSLRGLVSKNGDMISYDPTNTLIITERVGNLRRITRIIDQLDQRGYQETLEVIKLRYAPAVDTADKISRILDLKGGQRGGAPAAPGAGGDQGSQLISQIIPDERTNALIVLASREGLAQIREMVEKLDRAMEKEVGKGLIHVHYLQYADAAELASTLSSLSGGGGSAARPSRSGRTSGSQAGNIFPRTPGQATAPAQPAAGTTTANLSGFELFGGDVHITADVHTNSLVITASPSDYEALLQVISKLDIRRPQAFVEAMILEVDIDKAFDVGVASNLGTQVGSNNNTSLFGATNFGNYSSLTLPTSSAAIQGLAVGVQGRTIDIPLAGGEKLTIPVYGAFFRALQTSGTINVLSTPNILTRDNMEAEIVVGQVVPFITAQGRDVNNQPINQIQRENVAITLRVRPQINESDDVTMEIFQEIQDLVAGPDINTFGPTTSKRSATTTVLVKNGQTVTVGGLISEREQTSVSKVPVLGDIPLLGWFFKSKNRSKRKTSLVIFITPHIVRLPEDLQDLSVRKNEERQRFLKENNIPESPALQKYNLDRSLQVPVRLPPATSSEPVPADSPSGGFLPTGKGK